MASLPSVAITGTLRLGTELKRHPSATEKTSNISYQRSSINTQSDANLEPFKPLEFHEALSLIKEGEQVESSYYVPLLQHCIDKVSVPETEMVHAHVIKTGTHEEFFVMSFLVNVYAKCGVMVNARKVFDNLPRRNVVVWTTLMTGYVQNSQPEVAVEVFGDMLESGSFPSNFTLSIALNACSSLESITLGKQFHAFIIKYRISHDSSIGNALCSLYSKFGSLDSSVKAFRETGEKDVISWTTIISACGDNGRAGMGLRLFIEMLFENVEPNDFTLTSVLSLCSTIQSSDLGMQVMLKQWILRKTIFQHSKLELRHSACI